MNKLVLNNPERSKFFVNQTVSELVIEQLVTNMEVRVWSRILHMLNYLTPIDLRIKA